MATIVRLDGIDLPSGLIWQDRNAWQPVAQTMERTLGGRPVIEYQALSAGRPITLQGDRRQGWMTRATCDAVRQLADMAGAVFSLQIHTEVFQVVFRHHEPPAFDAEPIIARLNPGTNDYFIPVIRLMTV